MLVLILQESQVQVPMQWPGCEPRHTWSEALGIRDQNHEQWETRALAAGGRIHLANVIRNLRRLEKVNRINRVKSGSI